MAEEEKKKKEPIRISKAQLKAVSPDFNDTPYGMTRAEFEANKDAVLRDMRRNSEWYWQDKGKKRSRNSQIEELINKVLDRFAKDGSLDDDQKAAMHSALQALQALNLGVDSIALAQKAGDSGYDGTGRWGEKPRKLSDDEVEAEARLHKARESDHNRSGKMSPEKADFEAARSTQRKYHNMNNFNEDDKDRFDRSMNTAKLHLSKLYEDPSNPPEHFWRFIDAVQDLGSLGDSLYLSDRGEKDVRRHC